MKTKYDNVDAVILVGQFYELWEKTLAGDWTAYAEMISDKFPQEWTDFTDVSVCGIAEDLIPAEFVVYPVNDGTMTAAEIDSLKAILTPDLYVISGFSSSQEG